MWYHKGPGVRRHLVSRLALSWNNLILVGPQPSLWILWTGFSIFKKETMHDSTELCTHREQAGNILYVLTYRVPDNPLPTVDRCGPRGTHQLARDHTACGWSHSRVSPHSVHALCWGPHRVTSREVGSKQKDGHEPPRQHLSPQEVMTVNTVLA